MSLITDSVEVSEFLSHYRAQYTLANGSILIYNLTHPGARTQQKLVCCEWSDLPVDGTIRMQFEYDSVNYSVSFE